MNDIPLSYVGTSPFHCYRCGKEVGKVLDIRSDVEGNPYEISMVCPSCGSFAIDYRPGEGWRVKGTSVLYVQGAFSDTAYRYGTFDASSYPSREEALRAEEHILNDLVEECINSEAYAPLETVRKKHEDVLRECIESGMDDLADSYAVEILVRIGLVGDITADERAAILKAVHSTDAIGLGALYFLINFRDDEALRKAVHDRLDILDRELRTRDILDALPGLKALSAIHALDNDAERYIELYNYMIDSLAKNGSDDAKGAMAMLFVEACGILSGEDLRKALVDLRDMRDSHPAEFATCAMEYARLYIDDVLRREDIVDDLEWVRAHYVPLFREIDDGEGPDDESEVSYLLAVCSGSRSGMAAAIKKVIGRFDGDDVGTAWVISDYCARRDPTKGMVSWITKALNRMGMGLDDVEDLASVMHKRAP